MEIVTKRFLLRDFVDGDLPAFAAYHADPRSLEFYETHEGKHSHAQALIEIFRKWAAERPRLNYQMAIVRRDETQTLVGCCGLRCKDLEPGNAELGIELAPDYWGRYGYAIEVMRALVDFGFSDLELKEIYGSTVSVNARIARLARAYGTVAVERPTPARMVARGWKQVEFRIVRAQWEQGRLTIQSGGRRR